MKTHGISMLWCPYEDPWYNHAMMSLWRPMVYPCYDVPMKTHGITMLWCPYEDTWYIHAMMSLWRRMVYPCYDVPVKTHDITMLRCPRDLQWRFAHQEAEEKKMWCPTRFNYLPWWNELKTCLHKNNKTRIKLYDFTGVNKQAGYECHHI